MLTDCPIGGKEDAAFTDEGTFWVKAFCKLLKLPELVGAGRSPDAGVLDLAMSASACKILDVSGVGAALAVVAAPLSGMKSLGGEPVGVVDRGATD